MLSNEIALSGGESRSEDSTEQVGEDSDDVVDEYEGVVVLVDTGTS